MAGLERDVFQLRQQLAAAAERDLQRGRGSHHSLQLEAQLRDIQGQAIQLERRRAEIVQNINVLRGKQL